MENKDIDRSISRVKDFYVGEVVLYDGVIAKIEGFKNRNTVFLRGVSGGRGEWSTAKVGVKDLVKPSPMSAVEELLADEGVGLKEFFADCLTDGLRRKGIPAKVVVDETGSNDVLDVLIIAERPPKYVTLGFFKNER